MADSRTEQNPLIEAYVASLRAERGLSGHTVEAYRRDLLQFAAFLTERDVEVTEVGSPDLQAYEARLLRLGHLPYPRERLFRYVAWPPLAVITVGLGLSLFLEAPDQLLRNRVSVHDGVTVSALGSPVGAWQLTTAAPPLVTAPDGESHRPRARPFHRPANPFCTEHRPPRDPTSGVRMQAARRATLCFRGTCKASRRLPRKRCSS